MSNSKQDNFIRFNFDVSAYRLLGRELITDRITALFEIVKNSYDANSENVTISFINTTSKSNNSKIIIKDDGLGMTLDDLKNRWMVIGTSSKRRERTSPEPYNRKVVGKKGIGRFAVDLLGSKLTLKTKQKGSKNWTVLETDWSVYQKLEQQQLTLPFEEDKEFFTDIKNKYWFEEGDENTQGTILEIEKVNNDWTEYDIVRVTKELTKLVSPNAKLTQYPFNIKINSPFKDYDNLNVKPISIVDYATKSIKISYNKEEETQEIAIHDKGEIAIKNVPKRKFGFVDFTLYYFDQSAKNKLKKVYQSLETDGIKIYRDGIITTPFAEHEANQNKQKDILGIDKRRYSGFFDKLNSNDLLGYLEISDENNPNIIETTNRQDFIDNIEYSELKLFIIEQIEQIEKCLKYERNHVKETTKSDFKNANTGLKSIKKNLSQINMSASQEVNKQLKDVEADLSKLQGTVNKSIKDYAKLEQDSKQKESLFFSLVSLQTYASMFSHMTKHTIGHIIRDAEYFKNHFPNERLTDRFRSISTRIFDEMNTLRQGIDFMLKYAQSDDDIEDINLNDLLSNLFNNIYLDVFKRENIETQVEIAKNLELHYNKKALEDVFDNLISNSIKALKGRSNKKIKCSGIVSNDKLTLYFSDNGVGILEEDKYRIFDIFFTRTAEDGGAGIGLYMVKTRIEAMNGTIEVVENELKPTGATFKIVLPFEK